MQMYSYCLQFFSDITTKYEYRYAWIWIQQNIKEQINKKVISL